MRLRSFTAGCRLPPRLVTKALEPAFDQQVVPEWSVCSTRGSSQSARLSLPFVVSLSKYGGGRGVGYLPAGEDPVRNTPAIPRPSSDQPWWGSLAVNFVLCVLSARARGDRVFDRIFFIRDFFVIESERLRLGHLNCWYRSRSSLPRHACARKARLLGGNCVELVAWTKQYLFDYKQSERRLIHAGLEFSPFPSFPLFHLSASHRGVTTIFCYCWCRGFLWIEFVSGSTILPFSSVVCLIKRIRRGGRCEFSRMLNREIEPGERGGSCAPRWMIRVSPTATPDVPSVETREASCSWPWDIFVFLGDFRLTLFGW